MSDLTPSQRLVSRYFRMWNTGDTTDVDEILAATWVDHAHPEVRTPQDVARSVEQLRTARPDLQFRIDALLGDQDRVAAVGVVGTGATPPTPLIWLVEIADGRLTHLRTYHENPAR